MTTVALIQARMGSTRLPDKIFADIGGMPMLEHVIRRVQRARQVDIVAVATTTALRDDAVASYCEHAGVAFSRGEEDDVLSRYYTSARQFRADVIVRITADCPFIDPGQIDDVVTVLRDGAFDYVTNAMHCTYPDGLDVEAFSMRTLERVFQSARLKSEREHVTTFVIEHPDLFRIGSIEHDTDLSSLRWTVDEPRDLAFARLAVERMGSADFGWQELVQRIHEDPAMARLNGDIERNEGYALSLLNDGPAAPARPE